MDPPFTLGLALLAPEKLQKILCGIDGDSKIVFCGLYLVVVVNYLYMRFSC